MGAQLDGGEENELLWSDGCFLVLHWCAPFQEPDPIFRSDAERARYFMDRMGCLDASKTVVQKAHASVPTNFAEAKSQGQVPDGLRPGAFTEEEFEECRAFLAEAARQGTYLRGSA